MTHRKLKLGLLVESEQVPRWAFVMIRRILNLGIAEIELIVRDRSEVPKAGALQRLIRFRKFILYTVFSRLEKLLFPMDPDAMEDAALKDILPDVTVMDVHPRRTRLSDFIEGEELERIQSYDLDVLVRLGFRILRGGILKASRLGVWSFHHGDNHLNRGGPPGFWEVLENWPTTGSILQILTEDLDGGEVLYRSHSQTDLVSIHRNLNNYYWKSLAFLPRKLEELHRLGEDEFLRRLRLQNRHPVFYSRRIYLAPGNFELVKATLKHYFRYLRFKIRSLFFVDQWQLLFSLNRGGGISTSLWRFKSLTPPRDRFWADPHVLYRNEKYYVFLEDAPLPEGDGHIAAMEMDERGRLSPPQKVLQRPYHVSHPFLIEDGTDLFMVPETSGNRTVELYRCVQFPARWEFVMNLMDDVRAVDATLLRKDGRWWMFVNMVENEGASTLDELFLFSSTELQTNQWIPHPQNPVVSDVRRSRPAGALFEYGGSLYRPGQNSSSSYGFGMTIHQVDRLDEKVYEETPVSEIRPEWEKSVVATHSLAVCRDLTLIDARVRRFRWGR